MKGKKSDLTAERLRELLLYNPTTGIFTWRQHRHRVKAGSTAGHLEHTRGYVFIIVDGVNHRAHRLAWLYMTGQTPPEIDHKDLNRANNAWDNLRAATRSQNRANLPLQKNNTTGFKGVHIAKRCRIKRFVARLRNREIGYFATAKEAHDAYCRAAAELYGDFARDK